MKQWCALYVFLYSYGRRGVSQTGLAFDYGRLYLQVVMVDDGHKIHIIRVPPSKAVPILWQAKLFGHLWVFNISLAVTHMHV